MTPPLSSLSSSLLRAYGAPPVGIAVFAEWPAGLPLPRPDDGEAVAALAERVAELRIDVEWVWRHLLTADAGDEYGRRYADAGDECDRRYADAYAECERVRADTLIRLLSTPGNLRPTAPFLTPGGTL